METKRPTVLFLVVATFFSCYAHERLQAASPGFSHHLTKRSGGDGRNEARLPRYLAPNSYKLEIQPFLHEGHFRGHVTINFTCMEVTDTIVLHAHRDLEVVLAAMTLNNLGLNEELRTGRRIFKQMNQTHHYERISPSMNLTSVPISKLKRDLNKGWCEVVLTEELKKGVMYQLKLEFAGSLISKHAEGFYRQSYEDTETKELKWYLATHFKSRNARKVFPCFDEPQFKASFEISIARPAKLKTITNMPLKNTAVIANHTGWEMDHFAVTPPMSTFSLAIFIFDPTNLLPVTPVQIWGTVKVYGYAQKSELNEFQSKMDRLIHTIEILQSYLRMSFPLPELHLIAIPQKDTVLTDDYWGLIMFREDDLSTWTWSWNVMSAFPGQWVGHLASPHSWTDTDFNKGLTHFLFYVSVLDVIKGTEYENSVQWGPTTGYTSYYELSNVNETTEIQQKQLRIEWLLRMYNYAFTESTMKFALHDFLHERAFKTYFDDDFWDFLDNQAWLDDFLPSSVSTVDISRMWIKISRFPVITVRRNYEDNTATIEQHVFVREWPHQIAEENASLWWIPIMYLTRDNLDLNSLSTIAWMKESRQISIHHLPDRNTFIILNPEEIGMFMVNYDVSNWNMLSQYLLASASGSGQTLIPAETRSKLLHDALNLAMGGELDFGTALNMTLFLGYETCVPVWNTMFTMLSHIGWALHGTAACDKFNKYVGQLLSPALKNIHEYSSNNEVTKEFFNNAHNLLSIIGNGAEIEEARIEFYSLLPIGDDIDFQQSSLCGVFLWVDEDWNQGLQKVIDLLPSKNETSLRILLLSKLVTCTREPTKVEQILNMVLFDNNHTFPEEDIKAVFDSILDYPTFINFIKLNWQDIKLRLNDDSVLWDDMMKKATGKFKTQEGYDLVSELYRSHKHDLGSAKEIVENSLIIITDNMKGPFKFIPAVEEWLDQHVYPFIDDLAP